jgi:hypothetical protein
MNWTEVHAILGPPGHYTSHPIDIKTDYEGPILDWIAPIGSSPADDKLCGWWTDGGACLVRLDTTHCVKELAYFRVKEDPSRFGDLIELAKRHLRKWFA